MFSAPRQLGSYYYISAYIITVTMPSLLSTCALILNQMLRLEHVWEVTIRTRNRTLVKVYNKSTGWVDLQYSLKLDWSVCIQLILQTHQQILPKYCPDIHAPHSMFLVSNILEIWNLKAFSIALSVIVYSYGMSQTAEVTSCFCVILSHKTHVLWQEMYNNLW